MMNQVNKFSARKRHIRGWAGAGAWLALSVGCSGLILLSGCAAEEEEVVYTPPPPPPPPPPPAPPTVAELKAELRIDQRVYMSEEHAPPATETRKAVLSFFDAFARGDDRALGEMLSPLDRSELEAMVQSGQWKEATQAVTRIEVQAGTSPLGDECALAIFELGMDFEPQLWYYKHTNGRYVFDAAPSPPNMMQRLSGADLIASWHEILKEEEEMAERPDVPVQIPQRSVEEDSGPGAPQTAPGSTPSSPSSPSSPSTPSSPSGPPSLPTPG